MASNQTLIAPFGFKTDWKMLGLAAAA